MESFQAAAIVSVVSVIDIFVAPVLGYLLNHHPRRVLALRSLLSASSTVDAVAYDQTQAIQHAKLAGAAYCDGSVPS